MYASRQPQGELHRLSYALRLFDTRYACLLRHSWLRATLVRYVCLIATLV